MSAYFSMCLQFREEDWYPDFAADFDAHLEQSGLRFSSHWSHDCKQTLYNFGNYEEVRGYWVNQCPYSYWSEDEFSYHIIFPEREVVGENDYTIFFRPDRIVQLRELAERLWQFPAVRAIQTEMEDDDHTKLRELRRGALACAHPFAIVERDCHPYDDSSRVIELTQGKPGLLLLEDNNLQESVEETQHTL